MLCYYYAGPILVSEESGQVTILVIVQLMFSSVIIEFQASREV